MMTKNVTMKMLDLFNSTLKQNYIWIEDIYITGILRQLNNVSLVDLHGQFATKHGSNISFIAAHFDPLDPKQRMIFWEKYVYKPAE